MVAARANVWVCACEDGGWAVRQGEHRRLVRKLGTQVEALAVGQRLARREGAELIVEGHGGVTRLNGNAGTHESHRVA
ncbi:MAG TPA: DUF2188 domain-containing protein [Aggregatilineales bacterium]|nr:DUF2188 domain-containing protein [Aggregatilineales bacterium]